MKNFLRVVMFIAATQLITSCSLPSKNSFMAKDEVKVVENNKIYRNNKLFAELRYFNAFNVLPGDHHGVAIHYYPSDRELWICPREGWSVRRNDEEYTSIEKVTSLYEEFHRDLWLWIEGKADRRPQHVQLLLGGRQRPKLLPQCFDVRISKDGKYVFYKSRGVFFNSSHKYLVEYGMPK